MTKSILRKYAKLIVQMGVNIKKGQGAVILADTAQSEIALMVAEEAYRAGAKWVDIRWTNQDLDKMRYKKESVKVLSATQEWERRVCSMSLTSCRCAFGSTLTTRTA